LGLIPGMASPDIKIPKRTSQESANRPLPWRKQLIWIVLIAFLIRIAAIGITHTYRPRVTENHFGFGWEMGRIARSLAAGEGYASPFAHTGTGPTAWEPPIYPFFMAGVFKIFGTYTHVSAFVLLTVNSFFSALTCIPVFVLARRMFGLRVARWSAWAWALFPYAMYWCVKWLWETSITAFVLACLILLTMDLEHAEGYTRWLGWGLLWGFAALLNPSLLSFLPCAGLWLAWRRSRKHKQWFVPSLLAALFFCLTIAPWIARDYAVFGKFVFIRSNFGAEFRMGNGPGAKGLWMQWLHPSQNVIEFQKYKSMGELAYVRSRKAEALAWIHAHPSQFAKVTVARFVYYWANLPWMSWPLFAKNALFLTSSIVAIWGIVLAVRQRRRAAWLIAWLFISFPMVYYFVFPHPRYRAPIEPEITILICYVISQTKELQQDEVA